MTGEELSKLIALRAHLRNTGYFVFERGGTFLLYHSVPGAGNIKVCASNDIITFDRKVRKAVP